MSSSVSSAPSSIQMDKDFMVTISNLIDCTLTCKPEDNLSFMLRYFADDKATKVKEERDLLHAYHVIPFVLYNHESYEWYSCIVYSSFMISSSAASMYSDLFSIYSKMKSHFFRPTPLIDVIMRKMCNDSVDTHIGYSKVNDGDYNIKVCTVNKFKSFNTFIRVPIESFYIVCWYNDLLSVYNEAKYIHLSIHSNGSSLDALAYANIGASIIHNEIDGSEGNRVSFLSFVKKQAGKDSTYVCRQYVPIKNHKMWLILLVEILENTNSKYCCKSYDDVLTFVILENLMHLM